MKSILKFTMLSRTYDFRNPKYDTKKKVAKTTKAEGKGTPEKQGKGVLESPEKTSNVAVTAETPLGHETSKRADGSETGGNPENVSGILTGASTLLKTLKPCTKAVKVKRVMPSDGPTGLLDGGATNALRRGTPQELEASETVLVELAHGSVELKQHPLTGTILAEKAVEPIVPLRGLIELGFVIQWSSNGCEIKHPTKGTINCWLHNWLPCCVRVKCTGFDS